MMLDDAKLTAAERTATDELMRSLRTLWPDTEFKLFGSKANGTADEESDVDVLVVLPCDVTQEIRRTIVHRVFDVDLSHGTNISVLIVSRSEWDDSPLCVLPIHDHIETEGIRL